MQSGVYTAATPKIIKNTTKDHTHLEVHVCVALVQVRHAGLALAPRLAGSQHLVQRRQLGLQPAATTHERRRREVSWRHDERQAVGSSAAQGEQGKQAAGRTLQLSQPPRCPARAAAAAPGAPSHELHSSGQHSTAQHSTAQRSAGGSAVSNRDFIIQRIARFTRLNGCLASCLPASTTCMHAHTGVEGRLPLGALLLQQAVHVGGGVGVPAAAAGGRGWVGG